jgi:hypothetical protein
LICGRQVIGRDEPSPCLAVLLKIAGGRVEAVKVWPPAEKPTRNPARIKVRSLALIQMLLLWILFWTLLSCEDKNPEPSPHQAAIPSPSDSGPAPATVPPECPNTALSKSRQNLAVILQNIYRAEGRLITVRVAGADCDILELSGMLAEGNHTMEAAEHETINCAHCMLAYKKTKFKTIRFLRPDMNLEYSVQSEK